MKKNSNYVVVKKSKTKAKLKSADGKIKGFTFIPKNKNDYDGITVNKMVLVKPSLVENVLRRKIKKQLDFYLQYIINVIDSDDSDDSTNLRQALNELTRYKRTIQNNYKVYLEERYVELLLKKIKVLETELKMKISYSKNLENVEEKHSRRSR